MSNLILEGMDFVDLQCNVGVIADVTAINPFRLLLAISSLWDEVNPLTRAEIGLTTPTTVPLRLSAVDVPLHHPLVS
jgi:hypothetical protein